LCTTASLPPQEYYDLLGNSVSLKVLLNALVRYGDPDNWKFIIEKFLKNNNKDSELEQIFSIWIDRAHFTKLIPAVEFLISKFFIYSDLLSTKSEIIEMLIDQTFKYLSKQYQTKVTLYNVIGEQVRPLLNSSVKALLAEEGREVPIIPIEQKD
jgi:hypothetical protein